MSDALKHVMEESMKLEEKERLLLIDALCNSLEPPEGVPSDKDEQKFWALIDERRARIEAGGETIPAEVVMEELRQRYGD